MPGLILAPTPTSVMPQTLCLAFAESREYAQLRNEYHDGTPQASQLAQTSRKTFKLARRLTPSDLATLCGFYQDVNGPLGSFIFYNPFDALGPIGSNFDSSGVNTVGRYVVAFRNNWTQASGMRRTDVTGIELVQLAPMDTGFETFAGFGPHGAVTAATLSVLTSHVPGSPGAAPCFAQNPAANPITVLGVRSWMSGSSDGTAWTLRTDTASIPANQLVGLTWAFGSGPPNGIDTVADQLLIYDCSLAVTFQDGTHITYRPTSAAFDSSLTDPSGPGSGTNAGNAIDGNTATAATISADHWGTVFFSPILVLSNFA